MVQNSETGIRALDACLLFFRSLDSYWYGSVESMEIKLLTVLFLITLLSVSVYVFFFFFFEHHGNWVD